MSELQRQNVAELLRAGRTAPGATVDEMRADYAAAMAAPLPADVTADETDLGGRPTVRLRPDGALPDAALLYLHGGGYVMGSAHTGAGLAASLAHRIRITAYSVDYRIAPEHPHPAALIDALAAYRALTTLVDPRSIVVAGDSAGGGLAIAALVAARDEGLPLPAAVAAFSPWTDLTRSGESLRTKDGIDPLFTRQSIDDYAHRFLGDADPADPLASPMLADLRGLPPVLLQVGSHEVLLDDALGLAARAAHDDVDVTLEVVGRAPHVFQVWAGGMLDEADTALDHAAEFLTARLPVRV